MGLFSNFPYSDFENINLDWIIRKVKEYIDKTKLLEINFTDLKDYVTNYFDNLDVQEEINNKLDEMALDGTLASIIAQYLNTMSLLAFNTKQDMKSAENLIDGVDVLTLGDITYNDGNTNLYKIRTITSQDVVDEVNIVSLVNYPTLIAELIKYNYSIIYNELKDTINTGALDYIEDNYQPLNSNIKEIYVSDATGNDNNDGASVNTALKTLQKALDFYKKGYTSLLIKILDDATYYVDDYAFNGFTWHMTGQTMNGTVVVFRNGFRLYDCHTNFKNLTIDCRNSYPYQDGNYVVFENVKIVQQYRMNSGTLNATNIVAPQIVCSKANAIINNWTIEGTPVGSISSLLAIYDCASVKLAGTITINSITLTGDSTSFVNLYNIGVLYFMADVVNNQATLLTNAMRQSGGSILFITTAKLTSLADLSTNGNVQYSPSLRVSSSGVI